MKMTGYFLALQYKTLTIHSKVTNEDASKYFRNISCFL